MSTEAISINEEDIRKKKILAKYKDIPAELKEYNQWTRYHYGEGQDPKRPIGGPVDPEYSRSFETTVLGLEEGQLFGFKYTKFDPFIAIDADIREDLTEEELDEFYETREIPESIASLKAFVEKYPTYVEVSPSGKGLRILYKIERKSDLDDLGSVKNCFDFTGSLYISRQATTITGDKLNSETPTSIAVLSNQELRSLIIPKKQSHLKLVGSDSDSSEGSSESLKIRDINFNLKSVCDALESIPAVLTTSLKKMYLDRYSRKVNSYDHWITVAAALHSACSLIGKESDGAELFVEWSKTDKDKFTTEEDARSKYYENAPKESGGITFKTLFDIAKNLSPDWPVKLRNSKGKALNVPVMTQIENFHYLMDFYNIRIRENNVTHALQIHGDQKIMEKYFTTVAKPCEFIGNGLCVNNDLNIEEFTTLCHRFVQDYGFRGVAASTLRSHVSNWVMTKTVPFNFIREWIESREWDGKDRLEEFFQTLIFNTRQLKKIQLYRTYVLKNLFGIIRSHFYTGRYGGTTGVVIIRGVESSYKSQWVKSIFSQEMSEVYVGESQADGSNAKEMQMEIGKFQIILYDEIEKILSKNNAFVKNLLVQEFDMYRPLFSSTPVKVKRKCIFFGTTNSAHLPIGKDGSRRIQIVDIKRCDTSALEKIDRQQLFAQLLHIFNETPEEEQPELWNLSSDEIIATNANNSDSKIMSATEIFLTATWNFEHEFEEIDCFKNVEKYMLDRRRVLTTTEVLEMIQKHSGQVVNVAHLQHLLMDYCSHYTKSNSGEYILCEGFSGKKTPYEVRKGSIVDRAGQKRWIMPPTIRETEKKNDE